MGTRALALASVVVLLVVALTGPTDRSSAAQAASPVASPIASPVTVPVQAVATPDLGLSLPSEITLASLVGGQVDSLPATPARLVLERVTLAPDGSLGLTQAAGPVALAVAAGTLTVVDELGLEASLPEGGHVLLAAGSTYNARNDTDEAATLLQLSLTPGETAATPVVNETPSTADRDVLVTADVAELPQTPALLFLARTTWGARSRAGGTHLNGTGRPAGRDRDPDGGKTRRLGGTAWPRPERGLPSRHTEPGTQPGK